MFDGCAGADQLTAGQAVSLLRPYFNAPALLPVADGQQHLDRTRVQVGDRNRCPLARREATAARQLEPYGPTGTKAHGPIRLGSRTTGSSRTKRDTVFRTVLADDVGCDARGAPGRKGRAQAKQRE